MMATHETRVGVARVAIEGLSVGDAVGREFRGDTPPPWQYSDDTVMALAILEVLEQHRTIEQDALAAAFARRFEAEPERGYGPMAYWLLTQLTLGHDWRLVSKQVFRGQGSLGNGGAMRAAPIGAYFGDDLAEVTRQAQLSAEITHAHPDGQAGAIAIAVAAACAHTGAPLFDRVLAHTPPGESRAGIERAAALGRVDPRAAAATLGDGTLIRSSDTVPLALWCAAQHLDSYEAAMKTTLDACHEPASDRDTICAIVGSIVVLSAGIDSIPARWVSAREPLPFSSV